MVTQPEKERQIRRYIQDNCEHGRWSRLTVNSIVNNFSDAKFSAKLIKEILDKWVSNDILVKKRLEYDFLCLNNMQYEVDKKIKNHTSHGRFGSYILSFVIYFLLLNNSLIFNKYLGILEIDLNNLDKINFFNVLTTSFIISFVFVYLLSQGFQKIWFWLQLYNARIREYQWMSYPYLVLIFVALLVYYFFGRGEIAPITISYYFVGILGLGTAFNALIYQILKDTPKQ